MKESKAEESSVTLSFVPETWNFNNEEVKEVNLIAQFQNGSENEKIDYLKVIIHFPKDNLELTDYIDTTISSLGRQIRVDGPTVASESGQIIIELGALSAGAGPTTNDQQKTIAKMKFKGKSAIQNGSITIDENVDIFNNISASISQITKENFNFTVDDDSNTTGSPDEPISNPPENTGNVNLQMKLKLQGIISKPADLLNKMNIKVKLLNETTGQETKYKTAEFTADNKGIWSGNVSFNVDIEDKYVVFVKGPYHIQKKICNATSTETYPGSYHCSQGKITFKLGQNVFDFSNLYLLSGDLPEQDGSITAYDISLIRNNFGKGNDKCDVNRDGICDTQDYSLVIASLSVKNDEL